MNIVTGYETQADWDAMAEELEEMVRIRDRMGANHSYQQNFTPLVIYSNIALRHLERKTSIMNHTGEKTAGYFLDRIKPLNIRSKFNGKGSGTYIEQLILDFGPAGTDWLVAMIRDEGQHYIRFFGEPIREAAHRQLIKRGYDLLFFTPFRPKDWIFPNDHIDLFSQELKDMWWKRTEEFLATQEHPDTPIPRGKAFNHQLCLETLANKGNTMTTEEAAAKGLSCDKNRCQGCKMCQGAEEIKSMISRDISDEHSIDEIADILSSSREAKDIRIVFKKSAKWFFYSESTLAHYVTSKFLRADHDIAESFYKVNKTSHSWLANNGGRDWVSGYLVWNVGFRDNISVAKLQQYVDQINSELECGQIVALFDDTKTMQCKITDMNLYVATTDEYSLSGLKDKFVAWKDGGCMTYKFIKSMQGSETEASSMPELANSIFMAQKGKSIVIAMVLPAGLNPQLVLKSIVGKSYEKALNDFDVSCQETGVPVDGVGNDGHPLYYSVTKGKYSNCSLQEYGKKVLYALTK